MKKFLCVQIESIYIELPKELSEKEQEIKAKEVFNEAVENKKLQLFGWEVMDDIG